MNKKLCFYSNPFPRIRSYYDMIDAAAEYGLNAVEGFGFMEFEKPDFEAAKRIREYADKKNVSFPCFSVAVDFAAKRENKEMLKRYADLAKILGSPYLHHTIVGEYIEPQKVLPYKEKLFREGIEAVREIYDYAESIGIKAIYEEQGYIFNGIEGFGRFIGEVGREVGVVLDFGNIYESKDGLPEFVERFKHLIVHVHVKDIKLSSSNKGGGFGTLNGKYMFDAKLGEGDAEICEAIELLKKYGYNGFYSLEFGAESDGSSVMSDSINLLKSRL